jgi:hypothetical protein
VILAILATPALTGCVLFTKGPPLKVPKYELPAPKPFVDSFRATSSTASSGRWTISGLIPSAAEGN